VQQGPWKAIRFYNGSKPGKVELYDLIRDRGEQKDLAGKQPGLVRALCTIMDQQHTTAENGLFQVK